MRNVSPRDRKQTRGNIVIDTSPIFLNYSQYFSTTMCATMYLTISWIQNEILSNVMFPIMFSFSLNES